MIDAWLSSSERITVRSSVKRRDRRLVRVPARDVGERRLGADELGELALELEVRLERPADEAHRAGAGAVAAQPLDPGLDHLGLVGEAEVVVRREDEHLAAALHLHDGPLRRASVLKRLYVPASRSAVELGARGVGRAPRRRHRRHRAGTSAHRRVPSARPGAAARVDDDLAGLARLEQRERLLALLERQLVGDQRPQVDDAALEQPARPVPGLEDPAAVQRQHAQVLEDQRLATSISTGRDGIPKRITRPPLRAIRNASAIARGEPDISKTTSKPSPRSARGTSRRRRASRRRRRRARAHLLARPEPERRAVGRERPTPRPRRCAIADREQPDRPAAEHGDRAAGEVLLARSRRRRCRTAPGASRSRAAASSRSFCQITRLRHGDVAREGAVAVDAEDLRALAHVRVAGAARGSRRRR